MAEVPLSILFVGHEATRTGAPIGFLSLMKWLKESGVVAPTIWLKHGGPLIEGHTVLGPVAQGSDGRWDLARTPFAQLAYLNTATLGSFAKTLSARGVPVLCHVHEMDFELRLTGERNLRMLRHHVTRFIACSNAVKEALIRVMHVSPDLISVVPECVDVDRALRLAGGASGSLTQTRVLCGMGTVSWRKGVDLFLRVLASLVQADESWSGVWIGDLETGPDADRVRHDIRVLGLESRVQFTGSVANPYEHLARAEAFCLTSREDPYPLAMVEAAALGKPVVGFRGSGGVEEFVAEAGGVIVDYADTHAMARAVIDACAAEDKESRARRGLEAARRLCGPEAVGTAVASILERVASPDLIPLDDALVADLRRASEPISHTCVRLLQPGDGGGEFSRTDVESTSGGEAVFEDSWPRVDGAPCPSVVVSIEPQGRSVILSRLRVRTRLDGQSEASFRPAKVRTGGPGLMCSDVTPRSWLLLDGRGRLFFEVPLPVGAGEGGAVALTVSWMQSTDVKETLRPLLQGSSGMSPKSPAAGGTLWERLRRRLTRR